MVKKLLLVVAIVVAGVLVWQLTPLKDIARPEALVDRLDRIDAFRWAPLIMLGAYLVGGFVMFPVTVLGGAVAILFPPWKAVAVSLTGITLSAALHHWIGARFFKERAVASLGRIRERVEETVADRSIVTIAVLRTVPIAPFTLVNVVAGSMGIPRRDFLIGTVLGLAPSITIVCLFGRQVRQFWRDPSGSAALLIGIVVVAWVCLAVGLQWFVSRRKNKRSKAGAQGELAVTASTCSTKHG